jgi:hypothetical protein
VVTIRKELLSGRIAILQNDKISFRNAEGCESFAVY